MAGVVARIANPTGMRVNSCCWSASRSWPPRTSATWPRRPAPRPSSRRSTGSSARSRGDGRVAEARAYVKEQIKQLKLACIEAI